MKKQIALLILLFTINLSAQIKNEYYENGQIKTTRNLKNGAKYGEWKQYYENGKLYYDTGKINAIGKYDLNGFPIADSWKIYSKEGVIEKFDCPEPTKETYIGVCVALVQQDDARNPETGISFLYQERLWKMSCAKQGVDFGKLLQSKFKLCGISIEKNSDVIVQV